MRRSRALLTVFVAGFALCLTACPEGNGEDADAGSSSDSGSGPVDAGGQDSAQPPQDAAQPPTDAAQADSAQADAAINFVREVTIGYDDGLPAVKLVADPLAEGRIKFTPDPNHTPVQVKRVRFIPASAYSATLRIANDAMGQPGATLGSRDFTVSAGDVDQWFEVDITDLALQFDGVFWMVIAFPATLTGGQEVLYGGMSSSGQNFYYKPGYPPYMVNFDTITSVVVATPNDDAPPPLGGDGDACGAGIDCSSGFCAGGLCSITCTGSDCGPDRECRTFADGQQICVSICAATNECSGDAFCLTDTTFVDPAGVCIGSGPLAAGSDCQYHYHTICETGLCSACDNDPSLCADPGTCQ